MLHSTLSRGTKRVMLKSIFHFRSWWKSFRHSLSLLPIHPTEQTLLFIWIQERKTCVRLESIISCSLSTWILIRLKGFTIQVKTTEEQLTNNTFSFKEVNIVRKFSNAWWKNSNNSFTVEEIISGFPFDRNFEILKFNLKSRKLFQFTFSFETFWKLSATVTACH